MFSISVVHIGANDQKGDSKSWDFLTQQRCGPQNKTAGMLWPWAFCCSMENPQPIVGTLEHPESVRKDDAQGRSRQINTGHVLTFLRICHELSSWFLKRNTFPPLLEPEREIKAQSSLYLQYQQQDSPFLLHPASQLFTQI